MNFQEIINKGAIIIDVRTKQEFDCGHIHGSLNIPLDNFVNCLNWLVKDVPIILVCASGARSSMAKFILDSNGFKEVYDAGCWDNLGNIKAGGCKVK